MVSMSTNCEAVFWAVSRRFCGSEFDMNKATNNFFLCLFNVNGEIKKKIVQTV